MNEHTALTLVQRSCFVEVHLALFAKANLSRHEKRLIDTWRSRRMVWFCPLAGGMFHNEHNNHTFHDSNRPLFSRGLKNRKTTFGLNSILGVSFFDH